MAKWREEVELVSTEVWTSGENLQHRNEVSGARKCWDFMDY
jgi:hypothetical protein